LYTLSIDTTLDKGTINEWEEEEKRQLNCLFASIYDGSFSLIGSLRDKEVHHHCLKLYDGKAFSWLDEPLMSPNKRDAYNMRKGILLV
jgi:hypothetical protein